MATRSKEYDSNNNNYNYNKKSVEIPKYHDDGGKSNILTGEDVLKDMYSSFRSIDNSGLLTSAMHSANIFSRNEIKSALYNKIFRFGLNNPYDTISTAREYLFFTKPDLHILNMDDNGVLKDTNLNSALADIPFWVELWNERRDTTIKSLQLSITPSDPFNYLLQNQVISNLDVPGLSSDLIETPTNMFGTGYSYRGSSESSDDNPDFSLEFRDSRYLDVYRYFKAYEEYQTLKHHGLISPSKYYTVNKILHDQFSIYKFLVDEDMETIIYYGKMYGVMPRSLPREVFSNLNFDNGITYSIDFKAAFYEDMKPDIISDFNALSIDLYNSQPYQITPYNSILDHADTRPAKAAYIIKEASSISPTGYVYKLKWRGSDNI